MPKIETISWLCPRWRSVGLSMVLLLTGCGGPTWQTFHDAGAGFSADFPGKVLQPQGVAKSGTGGPTNYRFECRPPNGLTYIVTFVAQQNSNERIAARLDELESQKLEPDAPYTSLQTKRIQLGDIPGVEQVFKKETKYGNGFKRVRTFTVPTGDYYITVDSVTSADASSADAERFLNSFKIDAAK